MTLSEKLDILDHKTQLHQEIYIIYVVTEYEAQFFTTDGARLIAKARGDSIIDALLNLAEKIKDFDIKER